MVVADQSAEQNRHHRLESLTEYDLILEMANGRLLRQGRPEEMISQILEAVA